MSLFFSPMSTFSKDIGNLTGADDTGEPIYVKRKIVFGVDGQAFDVSSLNPLPVSVSGPALSTVDQGLGGISAWLVTDLTLSNNTQKSQLIDASGVSNTIKDISVQIAAGDKGIVTNSVIHGLTTGGGGGYVDAKVNPSGSLSVEVSKQFSSTSTITRVASSATSVTLLSLNSSRLGAVLFNESTQVCYVKFGTTASSTSYTIQVSSNSVLILDQSPIYQGRIDAIWASANGAMQITELT
jgi:hypothetical protein